MAGQQADPRGLPVLPGASSLCYNNNRANIKGELEGLLRHNYQIVCLCLFLPVSREE